MIMYLKINFYNENLKLKLKIINLLQVTILINLSSELFMFSTSLVYFFTCSMYQN